jgi:hypothetical protein
VHEADPGIELRIPGHALLDTRHADQNYATLILVKDRPNLFEAGHAQPVRLIEDDQGSGIADLVYPRVILISHLAPSRLQGRDGKGFVASAHRL